MIVQANRWRINGWNTEAQDAGRALVLTNVILITAPQGSGGRL
jgi:hypothetical protein